MAQPGLTTEQLIQVLANTLSPHAETRTNGKNYDLMGSWDCRLDPVKHSSNSILLSSVIVTYENIFFHFVAAEWQLKAAQQTPGHALHVLHLVEKSEVTNVDVQQAAAVHLKNMIKFGWGPKREVIIIITTERLH